MIAAQLVASCSGRVHLSPARGLASRVNSDSPLDGATRAGALGADGVVQLILWSCCHRGGARRTRCAALSHRRMPASLEEKPSLVQPKERTLRVPLPITPTQPPRTRPYPNEFRWSAIKKGLDAHKGLGKGCLRPIQPHPQPLWADGGWGRCAWSVRAERDGALGMWVLRCVGNATNSECSLSVTGYNWAGSRVTATVPFRSTTHICRVHRWRPLLMDTETSHVGMGMIAMHRHTVHTQHSRRRKQSVAPLALRVS